MSEVTLDSLTTAGYDDGDLTSSNATYATARDGSGVSLTDNYVLRVGQNTGYTIYQAFLCFNTGASIPDSCTIDSAVFKIVGDTDSSTTDFQINLYAYDWSASSGLDTGDFRTQAQLQALTRVAYFNTSGYSGGVNTFTSDADFLTTINKTGYTWLMLASDEQESGSAPTASEFVAFGSGENTGYVPQLTVNYTGSVVAPTINASQSGTNIVVSWS